ncbi:RDD family protein [Sulfurospirillum barnesii]|uniref:Putative membrane protein/domain protein n=1 Tax=Sulfurospirillum barnesii (strain ATCC 700032 / DSM 10660 / SES-3) TaxID=760154 RepID=I3Y0U4_SULBS|nr:RDD family protein [Sulfurospirillum barnesii]AFL69818.1 putative membrane protein/domain protein [Sulfurospirillum barnesii SES-3]
MRWRESKKGVKKEVQSTQPLYVIAPFSRRLKAFIVDSFMLLMPILYSVFYFIFGSREGFAEHMGMGWGIILLSYGLITTLFLVRKGQTPGYKAYEIELKELSSLKTPSWQRIFLRYSMMVITTASLFGLLVPLFRKDRRALYDVLSHTAPLCK